MLESQSLEQFKPAVEDEISPQELKKQLENELVQNQMERDEINAKISAVKKASQRAMALVGQEFPEATSLAEILSDENLLVVGGSKTVKELREPFLPFMFDDDQKEDNLPNWRVQLAELESRREKIEQELKELKIQEEISERGSYPTGKGINVQPSSKRIN